MLDKLKVHQVGGSRMTCYIFLINKVETQGRAYVIDQIKNFNKLVSCCTVHKAGLAEAYLVELNGAIFLVNGALSY